MTKEQKKHNEITEQIRTHKKMGNFTNNKYASMLSITTSDFSRKYRGKGKSFWSASNRIDLYKNKIITKELL